MPDQMLVEVDAAFKVIVGGRREAGRDAEGQQRAFQRRGEARRCGNSALPAACGSCLRCWGCSMLHLVASDSNRFLGRRYDAQSPGSADDCHVHADLQRRPGPFGGEHRHREPEAEGQAGTVAQESDSPEERVGGHSVATILASPESKGTTGRQSRSI